MSEETVTTSNMTDVMGRNTYRRGYVDLSSNRVNKVVQETLFKNKKRNTKTYKVESNSTYSSSEYNSSEDEENEDEQSDLRGKSAENSRVQIRKSEKQNNIQIPVYAYPSVIVFLLILVKFLFPIAEEEQTAAAVNISVLKNKYQTQPNETWDHFEAVIDDILALDPTHPAVFLLLYSNNDRITANDLVDDLAKYSTHKLGVDENYINVANEEFHHKEAKIDYGYLIDKYKPELLHRKVMVVKDLQNIPAYVAQTFHTFCDEFSPLVDRVVYLFTLKVDSIFGKEEYIAETSLKNAWKDLNSDKLMPLITRITSSVLKVFPA